MCIESLAYGNKVLYLVANREGLSLDILPIHFSLITNVFDNSIIESELE
jgi:hypothetical protein